MRDSNSGLKNVYIIIIIIICSQGRRNGGRPIVQFLSQK